MYPYAYVCAQTPIAGYNYDNMFQLPDLRRARSRRIAVSFCDSMWWRIWARCPQTWANGFRNSRIFSWRTITSHTARRLGQIWKNALQILWSLGTTWGENQSGWHMEIPPSKPRLQARLQMSKAKLVIGRLWEHALRLVYCQFLIRRFHGKVRNPYGLIGLFDVFGGWVGWQISRVLVLCMTITIGRLSKL